MDGPPEPTDFQLRLSVAHYGNAMMRLGMEMGSPVPNQDGQDVWRKKASEQARVLLWMILRREPTAEEIDDVL